MTEDPTRLVLDRVLEHQHEVETHAKRLAVPFLRKKLLPTPPEVRDAINSLDMRQRELVLRHHVYWEEWASRMGLDSLFHAAEQACSDLGQHDLTLGDSLEPKTLGDSFTSVKAAAQKDVIAYCAVVFGIRDCLKKLQRLRPDIAGAVETLKDEVFQADISQFLWKLRNNLVHGWAFTPSWTADLQSDRTWTGYILYPKSVLLRVGEWSKPAKKYLRTLEERIRLSTVVRDHFYLLNDLDIRLMEVFLCNPSPAEADFWEIELSQPEGSQRYRP